MIARKTIALLAGAMLFASRASLAQDAVVLSNKGHTSYVIVVSPEAIEPEKTAAKELRRFLEESTGAAFPVVEAKDA